MIILYSQIFDIKLYLASEDNNVKFWIYTFHTQLPVNLPNTEKYLSCAIILSSHYDENMILSVWYAWCVSRRAGLKWRTVRAEEPDTFIQFTCIYLGIYLVDNICRCNGFTVRIAVPLTTASGCELFHHCVFIQMVWHKKPISVYFYR